MTATNPPHQVEDRYRQKTNQLINSKTPNQYLQVISIPSEDGDEGKVFPAHWRNSRTETQKHDKLHDEERKELENHKEIRKRNIEHKRKDSSAVPDHLHTKGTRHPPTPPLPKRKKGFESTQGPNDRDTIRNFKCPWYVTGIYANYNFAEMWCLTDTDFNGLHRKVRKIWTVFCLYECMGWTCEKVLGYQVKDVISFGGMYVEIILQSPFNYLMITESLTKKTKATEEIGLTSQFKWKNGRMDTEENTRSVTDLGVQQLNK
ncbi:hypothetical protein FQA39_LY12508 [Lamprigera yunnana]|nr:hypothetical protein FQA39_LY12508 [Lamprigera yunnana]